MPQKESKFTKGSESEKRFRLSVCMLGALLILCAAVLFSKALFSLDATRDFFIESAFMVSEFSDAPDCFCDEIN